MSSSILHSCPFCGNVTEISDILADFVGNPHCTQCGLSASEGNMKAQDDLVSLFNTHMNMSGLVADGKGVLPASPPPITYSITQHYHHSAHVAQNPRIAPEPMHLQEKTTSNASASAHPVLEVLKHHNVDPASLSSSQLELFANAMPEQQARLIQMWQICPEPSNGPQWLTSPAGRGLANELDMWDAAQGACNDDSAHHAAEPYMVAGYDLAVQDSELYRTASPVDEPTTGTPYRVSNDPIYQVTGQRWWQRTQPTAMEY